MDFNVALLHDEMVDKTGKLVTTSLTPIDIHDLARSCTTYGVSRLYVAHSSPHLRKLARTLKGHWEDGHGATYNPNRKEALEQLELVPSLDDAISSIDSRTGEVPVLIATSAKPGGERISFQALREQLRSSNKSYLLMLGTGWGMSDNLLERTHMFLEPIHGPTPYNHLSVRSACAIMLDRLFGI